MNRIEESPEGAPARCRVLVAIVSFGSKNDRWLDEVLRRYLAMTAFAVDVVVLSNLPKALDPRVEVQVRPVPDDPKTFPLAIRELFAARRGRYDVYIGSEDDIAVEERNVRAFVEVSARMSASDVPGFLRYEVHPDGRRDVHDVHGPFGWVPGSARRIGELTIAQYENLHSAVYMLTAEHLESALASGCFFERPELRRASSMLEAATIHLFARCGLTKWFPVSRSDEFLLHHLSNVYLGKLGVSHGDFELYLEVLEDPCVGGDPFRLVPTASGVETVRFDKPHFEPVRRDILDLLGDACSILWVGSGQGATETWLISQGRRVLCVPLDAIHAAVLKRKGLSVCLGGLDQVVPSLPRGEFDAVVLPEVLERVPDPVRLLRQLRPSLAPKGRIVATMPNLWQWRNFAARDGGRTDRRSFGENVNYAHHGLHPVDRRTLRAWFRDGGFVGTVRYTGGGARRYRLGTLGLWSAALTTRLEAIVRRTWSPFSDRGYD